MDFDSNGYFSSEEKYISAAKLVKMLQTTLFHDIFFIRDTSFYQILT